MSGYLIVYDWDEECPRCYDGAFTSGFTDRNCPICFGRGHVHDVDHDAWHEWVEAHESEHI